MSKRDEMVAKYAADLEEKCGMSADMGLMKAITIACGPAIYNADSETVAGSDQEELDRVKNGFMKKRLGVSDAATADSAINAALDQYGRSNRTKYRPVFYYLLTKHLGKEANFS